MVVSVKEGTVNADLQFILQDDVVTIGTDPLDFDAQKDSARYDQVAVSGTVDGVNTIFTIAQAPSQAKALCLYQDGLFVPQIAGPRGYSLSGTTITMGTAPAPGQELYAEVPAANLT